MAGKVRRRAEPASPKRVRTRVPQTARPVPQGIRREAPRKATANRPTRILPGTDPANCPTGPQGITNPMHRRLMRAEIRARTAGTPMPGATRAKAPMPTRGRPGPPTKRRTR